MPDLMTATYHVTDSPVQDGQHVLHSGTCQVLPSDGLRNLGVHAACAPAMAQARALFDPVNGCAFCCPDCYTGTPAFEAGDRL